MNLRLDIFNIKDVQFGEKTAVSGGTLYINRQELQELLAKDKRFSKVDIDLAHPGESCRLVQILDIIEPRAKKRGTGENFPGVIGKRKTAGEGTTLVLRGTAIVVVDYTMGPGGMVFDMSGPIGDMGIYSKLHNIALLCHPSEGVPRDEYQNALTIAGLKAAVYLADAAQELKADETETYNLGALAEVGKGIEHLPRVTYIYQINSLQQFVGPKEAIIYGDNAAGLLPTILHPNEVFDGAIVEGHRVKNQETYTVQNHPVVKELYDRHSKDLCFVGVIATLAYATEPDRERAAIMAAKLAKSVLAADGAILTKIGGGAPHMDMAQTCEACEDVGVKTTLIVQDQSYGEGSAGVLIFNTPKADAIVNVGSFDRPISFPLVKRVIGGPVTYPDGKSAEGEIKMPTFHVCGVMSQIGASRLTAREI